MAYCVHTVLLGNDKTEATLKITDKQFIKKEWLEYFDTYEEALAAMPSGKAGKE